MKKLFLAAVAALFCAALSGCSVFETDTEALMHPPLLSEEQEKLNAALAQVAGENYTLKYPESGGSNSAFIFRDLDGDGEEEAMAFYSSVDESTRINVLKKDAEGWVSVYEAAGFSGDIKSIEFTFIDDKGEALIAKWADRIGVYRFAQNRLETIYTETCDGADITDINADGYSDVAVFKNNSADRSFFSVLFYNGTEMTVTEEIIVHAQYSNILSAKTGSLGNGKTAYFIDSSVYEGVYLTEIITLEEENAERYTIADFVTYEEEKEPEPEQEQEENVPTIIIVGGNLGKRGIFLRNTEVHCMDTNGDGIMELPVEVREDYARKKSDELYYIQFEQVVEENTITVWNGAVNPENGFLFEVPEAWNDRTKLNYNSLNNELVFIEKESGKVIFKICTVQKSDYQDKYEEYTLVAEDGTRNFYAKSFAEPEDNFYIDPEEFEERFMFM